MLDRPHPKGTTVADVPCLQSISATLVLSLGSVRSKSGQQVIMHSY